MHPDAGRWEALAWGEVATERESAELLAHLRACRPCTSFFLALSPVPFYFSGRPFPAEMRPMPYDAVDQTMRKWRIPASRGPMIIDGFAEDEALFHAAREGLRAEGLHVECVWNGRVRGDTNGVAALIGEGRWESLRAILEDAGQLARARLVAKLGCGLDVEEEELTGWENPKLLLAPVRETGRGSGRRWTVPGRWCFQSLFREWADKNQQIFACISPGSGVSI